MKTSNRNLPLTTRILAALPGPKTLWASLWALLIVLRPFLLMYLVRLSGRPAELEFFVGELRQHIVLAYMVVLALWAGERVQQEVDTVEPAVARLTGGDTQVVNPPSIVGFGVVSGPVVLTLVITTIFTVTLIEPYGLAVAVAVMIPTAFIVNLPLMSLFWDGLSVLTGLDRLGRLPLRLDQFPHDPSLGLRPIGALGATALWVFAAVLVPYMLVSIDSRVELTIGLIIFLTGIGLFFLSMVRLHRQMVAAKHRYLASARALYAEAFEPIKRSWTLRALAERAPLLSAAKALEDRALVIQEWPFDERTNSRIVILVSSVTVGAISRLALGALGL